MWSRRQRLVVMPSLLSSSVVVDVGVMRVRRFAETYGEGELATVASLGAWRW
jgi:hypothetical protein